MARSRHPAGPKPTHVRVRMYQVGFGDCFLVSFTYARALDDGRKERHLLIDFGSTRAPPSGGVDLTDVATHLAADCVGQIDVLVCTHRHKDHLSGFGLPGVCADRRRPEAEARRAPVDGGSEGARGTRPRRTSGSRRAASSRACRRPSTSPASSRRPSTRRRGFAARRRSWRTTSSRTRRRSRTSTDGRPTATPPMSRTDAVADRGVRPGHHRAGSRPADDRRVAGGRDPARGQPRVLDRAAGAARAGARRRRGSARGCSTSRSRQASRPAPSAGSSTASATSTSPRSSASSARSTTR